MNMPVVALAGPASTLTTRPSSTLTARLQLSGQSRGHAVSTTVALRRRGLAGTAGILAHRMAQLRRGSRASRGSRGDADHAETRRTRRYGGRGDTDHAERAANSLEVLAGSSCGL